MCHIILPTVYNPALLFICSYVKFNGFALVTIPCLIRFWIILTCVVKRTQISPHLRWALCNPHVHLWSIISQILPKLAIPLSMLMSFCHLQMSVYTISHEVWVYVHVAVALSCMVHIPSRSTQVVVTNTVPHEIQKMQCHKIKTVDISVMLVEAIRRIHNNESMSYLFRNIGMED